MQFLRFSEEWPWYDIQHNKNLLISNFCWAIFFYSHLFLLSQCNTSFENIRCILKRATNNFEQRKLKFKESFWILELIAYSMKLFSVCVCVCVLVWVSTAISLGKIYIYVWYGLCMCLRTHILTDYKNNIRLVTI